MGGVTVNEKWRPLPENAEYELSIDGRLRGPRGPRMPYVQMNKTAHSAMYMIRLASEGRCKAVVIHSAMRKIWGIEFEPTMAWVEQVRAEIMAEKSNTRSVAKLKRSPRPERLSLRSEQPSGRCCVDCGEPLPAGYWRRCPECWATVRKGQDMPLEEYGTARR